MNKEFEKIIEKLETYSDTDEAEHYGTIPVIELDRAIDIVKQEAEQYNNGWISVKEMLPEKEGSYLVIGKSGGAIVTRWYKPSKFHPNGHFGGTCSDYIRYWMPRPEPPQPYQPKGE